MITVETWITLLRKFRQWEWYQNSNMVHLFIHLLLSANHTDNSWQGKIIKRGQLAAGRKKLSADTGISEQTIRTCFNKLILTNEINIKSTSKFSIITICKYDEYQPKTLVTNHQTNHQTNQQLTNNQPATNQQLTTNNNDKNDKNVKNEDNIYNGTDISFNNFYSTYDKNADKKRCENKWATMSKKKKKLAVDYLPGYKATKEKMYRKDPIRYLNHSVWENELIKEETPESKQAKISKNLKEKWEKEDAGKIN
ncbi:hypothetical protein LCGC14_0593730 [marine sediment metagenome]|uniref:Bacteriophage lambda Replication protein O N-terminal domain-containing protein n=1 Tax=marine sediment metagenome TaxID=412755 RepID=A0A0F9UL73_9ZZZZ